MKCSSDVRVLEIGQQVEEIILSVGPAFEEVKHKARLHTRCIMLAQQLDLGVEVMSAAKQVNALQHAGVQWYHEQ